MKVNVCSIGVDRFVNPDDSLDSLSHCSSDAEAFLRQLKSYDIVDVSRLLTPSGQTLPTRSNLIKHVANIARYSNKSPMIVYFAGHGVNISGEFHLLPFDFDRSIPQYSAVGISLLMDIVSPEVPWVLFFLDACRSSLLTPKQGRRSPKRGTHGLLVSENACVLFGCSPGESSLELPVINGELGGGIFTHFFLQELQSMSRHRGEIDLSLVFGASRDKVSSYVAEAGLGTQSPRSVGLDPSEIFFILERKYDV